MDQRTWIFHLCLCLGWLFDSIFCDHGYASPWNPRLIRMGVAYDFDITPYNMQSTWGDRILIPDRDVTFPSGGKLLNFSYWLSTDDPYCRVKVVALSRDYSGGYTINEVSAEYNLGSFGWNTINFTLDDGYLTVKAGDTIGFNFFDRNYMKYFFTAPGNGSCTSDGIMELIYSYYYNLNPGDYFTNTYDVTSTSYCRSYIYQANYIPDDVYLNITLNSNQTLNQSLHSDNTNSMSWNVTAPPASDGEVVVVMAVFTTIVLYGSKGSNYASGCKGSAVKLVDGNGRTLKFLCGSSSSVIGSKIYSITDNMKIKYSSIANYRDTRITLTLSVIKKSQVPASYYSQFDGTLGAGTIAGIVVAIIVVAAIIGFFIYKKKKASVASEPAPADVAFKPRAHPKPERAPPAKNPPSAPPTQPAYVISALRADVKPEPPPPAWNQPSAPPTQPPYQPMGGGYFPGPAPPPPGAAPPGMYPPANYPPVYPPVNPAYPPP